MLGRIIMPLLSGTSLGAGLMYLLDPDHGPRRRKEVRRGASDAYNSAVDWARPTADEWRGRLSKRMAAVAQRVSSHAGEDESPDRSPARSGAARILSRRSRDLPGQARGAYARARDMYYDALADLDSARARRRRKTGGKASGSGPDYFKIALIAAGCCCAGAGIMYMLDPVTGRRRRAVTRDKAYSLAHRTTNSVRGAVDRTTWRMHNYRQGRAARAAHRQDEWVPDDRLVARVRSALGRVVTHPGAVCVDADNGSVTLSGQVLASEFDALMKCVYNVPGVREVINRIEGPTIVGHAPAMQG